MVSRIVSFDFSVTSAQCAFQIDISGFEIQNTPYILYIERENVLDVDSGRTLLSLSRTLGSHSWKLSTRQLDLLPTVILVNFYTIEYVSGINFEQE